MMKVVGEKGLDSKEGDVGSKRAPPSSVSLQLGNVLVTKIRGTPRMIGGEIA
jgi:hypothetical protein